MRQEIGRVSETGVSKLMSDYQASFLCSVSCIFGIRNRTKTVTNVSYFS